MPRGRMMRAAFTASAVSSARTNKAIRKDIESNQAAQATPAPQPAPVQAQPKDHIARLEQLASLRDNGVLTEEEFAKKKQEILAEM